MEFDAYERLRAQCLQCSDCALCATRHQVVFDRGTSTARLLFIGESPGASEDAEGRAFVGAAGKLLDELIAEAGIPADRFLIVNTIKCVSPLTRVKMADGTSMTIRNIVRSKHPGPVLSVDEHGAIVPKKITGWYRSPIGGRRLLLLSYRNAPETGGLGRAGVTLTEDHEVMTRSGWRPAGSITDGEVIATGQPAPGPSTFQILLGTMLGDASISKKSVLFFGHCIRQKEWATLKGEKFRPFGIRFNELSVSATRGGKRYPSIHFCTRRSAYWRYMRQKFYPQGHKIVPRDIISNIDNLGLATWFCDDGSIVTKKDGKLRKGPLAEIATCGFSEDDVRWLASLLNDRGFECRVRFGSGWRIAFTAIGTRAFATAIAPYTPVSMRYKLPTDLSDVEFKREAYQPEPLSVFWDEAVVREIRNKGLKSHKFMCLDVEDTRAFITPGGVVHNCRPPSNDYPGDPKSHFRVEDTVLRCLPWLDQQVEIVQPKAIVLVGHKAVVWTVYRSHRPPFPPMSDLFGRWIKSDRYSGVAIFAMYHTSYLLRVNQVNPTEGAALRAEMLKVLQQAWGVVQGQLPETASLRVRGDDKEYEQLKFF